MYRTNSYQANEEKPQKMKKHFSIQQILGFAYFMIVKGFLAGIFWLFTHIIMVPNDRIPHTDPLIVRIFGTISLIGISIGVSVIAFLVMRYLWEVMQGRDSL